jgi:isopenicillin N synthase-like dioxygenase
MNSTQRSSRIFDDVSRVGTIDISPLLHLSGSSADHDEAISDVARQIDEACSSVGFFLISGHGIDTALASRLDAAARTFFALTDDDKAAVAMPLAGRAWRGWFPVGGELTSGRPDRKEGLYVGIELPQDDPRVVAGLPLHGPNLFPTHPGELGPLIGEWFAAMTRLGHLLMRALSRSLGLVDSWINDHLTADPVCLFRIFHYPPGDESDWGVGAHTDYGLLTILMQDDCGGLQVRAGTEWVDVEPVENTFVCNVGDMLERMTAGRWRSAPHRVRNTSGRSRLSFPFFFDPSWNADVIAIPTAGAPVTGAEQRWDGRSVHEFSGTYGDYLLGKVSKVFPDLQNEVL